MSLKALSKAILQGNQQGNQGETLGFLPGNRKETEAPAGLVQCTPMKTGISRKEIVKSARHMGRAGEPASEEDLYQLLVDELRQIEALRESWEGWRASLNLEQRNQLRDIERRIDDAYASIDRFRLTAVMEEYLYFAKKT